MKVIFKLLVLACFFASCGSESPSIDSLLIQNENAEILKQEGAQLDFSYSFSDDNGLGKFRVEVIDDFEDAKVASAPWYFTEDYDLSGTSSSGSKSITLPYPDVELGRYKLTITVSDIDDQEAAQNKTFRVVE